MKLPVKMPTRIPLRLALPRPQLLRPLHQSIVRAANVAPVVGTGPPPDPPTPAVRNAHERVERRKKHAELLRAARQVQSAQDGKSGGAAVRFWREVRVQEADGAFQVHLDSRPLRHPNTKAVIRLPLSKPDLASALALEWDVLTSAQQAAKQHLIPLTSLVCRALDVLDDDAAGGPEAAKIRASVTNTVLRYLDTDSLLCWAPPAGPHDRRNDAGESLRDVQKTAAEETVGYLTTHVWPGITIEPVMDGHSIMPKKQSDGVREMVQGWVMGLDAWEIAGLERAVLAGKSLVAAARIVAEWSEGPVGTGRAVPVGGFGVEHASKATSLEVDWQAEQWGEVEDTHDVNQEDLRRQLGSVVLLVSGTGKQRC
ncbi:atp synthase mitochondrial f1 complex assembly factor 2 [Trichoderma cornu-damae]|uniref:Atp synthase mitochondrial f1 complex assembly factor 2 n=1 Tax=Trichoderma cornu-damae TaxID=654480 RepID=A0A9P8QLA9_9HYPO|nr:atp synthase mitochondrial f1 complex assembly factor 2 [Trichoderma cornu-damae]